MPSHSETEFRFRNLRGRDKRCMYLHSNDDAFEHLHLRPKRQYSPKSKVGNSKKVNSPYNAPKIRKRILARYYFRLECAYELYKTNRNSQVCKNKKYNCKIYKTQFTINQLISSNLSVQLKQRSYTMALFINQMHKRNFNKDDVKIILSTNNYLVFACKFEYFYSDNNAIYREFVFNELITYIDLASLNKKLLILMKNCLYLTNLISIVIEYVAMEAFFESQNYLIDFLNGWKTCKICQLCEILSKKHICHSNIKNIFEENEDYIKEIFL